MGGPAIESTAPVFLAEHDVAWRQEFLQIRSTLFDATQGRLLQVEPIGGTAVPGLPSQPVIDILAVRDSDVPLAELSDLIAGTNFRDLGGLADAGDAVRRMRRPRSGRTTHQLFLTLPDDPFREQALQFRDWLIRNPTDAARYAELKRYLADLFPEAREDYTRGKIGFFRHIQRLYEEAAATF